ncbi:FAD-binding domain-containing protein [Schizopora paradoxa]|uniref:FAD-binding domain-containing protein n=1 Tax=Schizopora paradoxa TaxID=27342 RepID=A0A0H2R1E2_9AGAM|nr:FAD-binding domain-containing protein [Schizopora paradoxa]
MVFDKIRALLSIAVLVEPLFVACTSTSQLFEGSPFARSCFPTGESNATSAFNSDACKTVRAGYSNETLRFNTIGGYINTQWETCQATGEQCLLDFTNPSNIKAVESPFQCRNGSVPRYFVNVTSPEDIVFGLKSSRDLGLPLIVKNTGHDYKGRSSAPGSIALWMHHLQKIEHDTNFVPEGCSASSEHNAVTIGAGVQFKDLYAFAEANSFTFVGGSDNGVGASGGWVQGGGHGALSNTMGLGVDRVLEFKVVITNGTLLTANACQNTDLFFALRGGGGGTFGVVYESTHLVSPPVTLQVAAVLLSQTNSTLTKGLWKVIIDNSLRWTQEGWGSFVTADSALFLNPVLNSSEANISMLPLLDFGENLNKSGVAGVEVLFQEFPSWGTFFSTFSGTDSAAIGESLALASRLIPEDNFATNDSRQALLDALLAAEEASPGVRFLGSTPFNFAGDGMTSVTDAWRTSIYHVTLIAPFNYNATLEEKKGNYSLASQSIDNLRRLTPDAAYSNEADVHEPNHEVAFWGNHYDKLLGIKRAYDPDHILDCWQCVGWNPSDPRFQCYI